MRGMNAVKQNSDGNSNYNWRAGVVGAVLNGLESELEELHIRGLIEAM